MRVDIDEAALAAAGPRGLSDELERGRIVCFPTCPLSLPGSDDLAFLRSLGGHLRRKNVSWYPEADRLKGLESRPDLRDRARSILAAHSARVQALLQRLMPEFTRGWTPGTSSFRPLEERGRKLSAHASNELIHVDAGAYGATHGDRILRFFVNVNEREDRVWASQGAFPALYRAHAAEAGLALAKTRGTTSIPASRGDGDGSVLEEGPLDRARTALLRGLSRVVPMARQLDSSPYDRKMRRFHNYMKDTPSFQAAGSEYRTFSFKPFTAWMVLTDGVSHACLSGQHALVDTFVVPLGNCRLRELSPYEILRSE